MPNTNYELHPCYSTMAKLNARFSCYFFPKIKELNASISHYFLEIVEIMDFDKDSVGFELDSKLK